MADLGNAVTARWVGPNGMQLYDGTALSTGVLVDGIGYDEAKGNPYWEIVAKPGKDEAAVASVEDNRSDWSFGSEEGGEGTGRPEVASDETPAPAPQTTPTKSDKGADS